MDRRAALTVVSKRQHFVYGLFFEVYQISAESNCEPGAHEEVVRRVVQTCSGLNVPLDVIAD